MKVLDRVGQDYLDLEMEVPAVLVIRDHTSGLMLQYVERR